MSSNGTAGCRTWKRSADGESGSHQYPSLTISLGSWTDGRVTVLTYTADMNWPTVYHNPCMRLANGGSDGGNRAWNVDVTEPRRPTTSQLLNNCNPE